MKLCSIQCLRALAAIGVLLFHFGDIGIGAGGVDLFFVISGFIMASVMPGKTPARFLADRVWRILPLYYAAVALELIVNQPSFDLYRLAITATLWPVGLPYLHQSWTLSYELLFYVGCAAFLGWGRSTLAVVPILFLCARLTDDPLADFMGSPLLLEFLGGVMLAHLPRRYGGLALLAAPIVLALLWPLGIDRLFTFGIPALLLVHGALALEQRLSSRWFAPIMLLGDASYAIYLVHLTIGRIFPGDVAWMTAASVSLVGGLLFHMAVERPLMHGVRALRKAMRDFKRLETGSLRSEEEQLSLARTPDISRTTN